MVSLYISGPSWAHRLPASVKLVFLCLITLLLFPLDQWWQQAIGLAAVLGFYGSLGKKGLKALKVLKNLLWMLSFIFLIHLAFTSWEDGIVISLRLVTLVLLANFLSITTKMDDLMDAIEPLFRPLSVFGVTSKKIALAVALVIRFVPMLMAVFMSLQEAYRARTGKGSSMRLLAPFVIHALKLADEVAEALTARGGADGYKNTASR
ncbi:energy-coupling factor transporter transmembrane protein EcfT [Pseudovibrio sp. SPO723]|uniref:energy-coupling factor transporter transmembrane component T family protein n=1 Tax=Nesiotobacter zosterae TaxID=392721 RepID=UPI0029C16392|nr:energy-coupling factor transporter transmembrane protein EcfT [Pseudovibrio sp. SPO723]MDX5594848.1 energy-coupling factor transporter transmembrane protein EcfT [Pseudovibrio sp. SPO723]